jgi:small subunit ribosomal protein S6
MLLLDTNKVAGDVPAAAKQLKTILERHHAEIMASRPWDERRLAYPIKKHKKGLYYLTYFTTEGKNLVPLKRDFALNEMILRSLILKVHPKMVQTMLAVAHDEHALAVQMMAEEPTDEGNGMGGGGHSGGPRRGGGRRERTPAEAAEKE